MFGTSATRRPVTKFKETYRCALSLTQDSELQSRSIQLRSISPSRISMDSWSLILYALPLALIVARVPVTSTAHASHGIGVLMRNRSRSRPDRAGIAASGDRSEPLPGLRRLRDGLPGQPHHTVLGLIDGKAVLVGPSDCIGHGACKTVCPFDAITLVFGTERRGVDIPVLKPNFESNVPGIFMAGELGGMGLIRNALVQGQPGPGSDRRGERTQPRARSTC